MPDTAPIARLRRIVAAAEAGVPLPPADASWLVLGLRQYEAARIAGHDLQLDRALDLSGPARHGWWAVEAMEERNRLLRQVRVETYPHLDPGAAAGAILAALRRPAQRGRKRGDEGATWSALRAAIARTGRAVPCAKHLTRLLNAGTNDPPGIYP